MSYLTEAFKQMELLESEQFTFDKNGAAKLANFLDDDMLNDFEAIIDPEAETKEELKDSYMGNVICRCPICRSLIYRDPEDIEVDEEEQLANLEEPCPYCFEHGGFEIVGQVAPYEEITVEGANENTKVEVDGEKVEVESNENLQENFDNAVGTKAWTDKVITFYTEAAKNLGLSDFKMIEKGNTAYLEAKKDGKVLKGTLTYQESHAKDISDAEEAIKFAIPELEDNSLTEGVYDKLVKAFPELEDDGMVEVRSKRRHARDNEDIEDSQRFPVEGTNQRNLVERRCAKRRHTRDNEDLEDSQRYPIESPVGTKGLKENIEEESETAKRDPKARLMSKRRHVRDNEDLEDSQRYPIESPAPAQTGLRESTNENFDNSVGTKAWTDKVIKFYEEAAKKLGATDLTMKEKQGTAYITLKKDGKELNGKLDWQDSHAKNVEDAIEALQFAMPDLYESLRESMEDISITTDDQVIKVKATPRADKETIQPVEEETKDAIEAPEMEEEATVEEDMPLEDQDVEIEEFDEESFDNLGESYLRQVYENVSGFKTSDVQSTTNKIIVEGIISFNSGKKAKTKFMFEAKDATKSGKLRFTGLNENISKNKKAFTLTGILKENKLISESLNYNYSAQAENGKSKRLYGTVRR